ncbi:MAG: HAD family hydrolase [Deltaproteobacteria bacterium]|nr:HAD family hydrolase [Deltaproteobacteria bacterium]
MSKPAVFVDRDGTLNEQMGYINHVSRFVLLPGAADAIRLLNKNGHLAIVVSNQSGAARGYFPVELVEEVHAHMRAMLKREDALLDGILFCPHSPGAGCDCRKPGTGLIEKACQEFDIDMSRSYVIGDRSTDIEMAARADLKGILVETGYGLGEVDHVLPQKAVKPVYVAKDVFHAVQWILGKNSPRINTDLLADPADLCGDG